MDSLLSKRMMTRMTIFEMANVPSKELNGSALMFVSLLPIRKLFLDSVPSDPGDLEQSRTTDSLNQYLLRT